MFSISTSEFPYLTEIVNKLKSSPLEKSEFDEIREWCAEKGFLLHFSKSDVSLPASLSNVFYTLKYDRAKLTPEQYATVGKIRSVVFDRNGNICCIAPPKMLPLTDELKTQEVNSVSSTLVAEELVEGIMVNLFWKANDSKDSSEEGKWYIATKSCVGEVSFDHIIQSEAEAQAAQTVQTTDAPDATDAPEAATVEPRGFQKLGVQEILRRRICEVLSLLPGGLNTIPKNYCYSCVIQHPKNQIVNQITVPKLYLVAVYELKPLEGDSQVGVNVIRINRDIFSHNFGGSVTHMPSTLTCVLDNTVTSAASITHTVEDYCNMYASTETHSVSMPGIVFVDKDTGFCYKKRNPKYESVKKRKGMEQKLAAQYLQLRKDHGIDEYLKYHPQHSRAFHQFRERLHEYTQKLYDAYIEHYVKKDAKPLKDYDRELKIHMYKLHYDVYLARMKESGIFVTKHTVIDYVNQLAMSQQLACLNATPAPVRDTTTTQMTTQMATVKSAQSSNKQYHQGNSHTQSHSQSQPQKKLIERSRPKTDSSESKSGFRNARPARGGRMVPSLSVHIPVTDDAVTSEVHTQVKGAKTTGSVKVQNQFAGLQVDE